jgi:hypothetical protein
MKLEAERVTRLERLHRKVVALGKQFSAARQMKTLAMPVIDALRPVGQSACPAAVGRIG